MAELTEKGSLIAGVLAAIGASVCCVRLLVVVALGIGRYAHHVGRDNVMAAADCGFSIPVGSGGVDPDVVWAKLSSLAPGAAIAPKKFWP